MDDWSSFQSDVAAGSVPKYPRCTTRLMLNSLTTEARAAVESVLANPDITGAAIRSALRKRVAGNVPSAQSINRHRRGGCGCTEGE